MSVFEKVNVVVLPDNILYSDCNIYIGDNAVVEILQDGKLKAIAHASNYTITKREE